MTCQQCGTDNPEGARFCRACGTPLGAAESAAAGPPPPSAEPTIPTPTVPPLTVPPLTAPAAPAAGAPTAPPPPGSPPPPPSTTTATPPPPDEPSTSGSKRSIRPFLLAGVGVIALVIIGAVAWSLLTGTSGYAGGASSAQGAVEKLADSVEAKDLAAAIAVMNPEEMRGAKDVVLDVRDHATEVGVAPGGDADAFTISIEDLDLREDELAPDVVKVELRGGTITASADTGKLPEALKAAVAPGEPEVTTADEIDLRDATIIDYEGNETAPFLIVVKRHGSWFISPMATAAELFTQQAGLPTGRFSTTEGDASNQDAKASSPTEAVEGLAAAAEDMDVAGVADYMVASERWLVDAYTPAIRDLVASGSDVVVDPRSLTEEDLSDGRKAVRLEDVELGGTWTDDYGDSSSSQISLSDDCLTDSSGETECLPSEFTDLTGIDGAYIVTVKEDGQWRVSLVETALSYLRTANETIGVETIAGLNPAWAATMVDPQTNIAAGGGSADVTLNELGYAVMTVDASADGALTIQAGDDDDYAEVTGVYDAEHRPWTYDSAYVVSPTDQKLTVVVAGDAGDTVTVTVGSVTTADAGPGPIQSTDSYLLATLQVANDAIVTVTPSDDLLYAYIPEDPSDGWTTEYGDASGTCTQATCQGYGSAIRLLLPPQTSVTVATVATGFDDTTSTVVRGTVVPGGRATHTFFLPAYESRSVALLPSGFDGILEVTCDGDTYREDIGLTDGREQVDIDYVSQDSTCQVNVTVWGDAGGAYTLQLT